LAAKIHHIFVTQHIMYVKSGFFWPFQEKFVSLPTNK